MPGHVDQGGVTIYAPSAPPGSGAGGAITLQDAYEGGNSISVSAAQGGPVTISGDSATVGLLFTSTARQEAIQIYNTADQVTNYERLAIRWTGNTALIMAEKAAGGTERALSIQAASGATGLTLEASSGFLTLIGSSGSAFISKPNADNVGIQWRSRIVATTTAGHLFINDSSGSSYSASSGTQNFVSIEPAINQSGTAAYNALRIVATETATGSGAHRLIFASTAAADYFAINTVLANNETSIECRVDRAGAETFERFLVGAAGTAGASFRAICIPN